MMRSASGISNRATDSETILSCIEVNCLHDIESVVLENVEISDSGNDNSNGGALKVMGQSISRVSNVGCLFANNRGSLGGAIYIEGNNGILHHLKLRAQWR